MKNNLTAKKEFDNKLEKLKKEASHSIYAHNLGEIVLYEKLLELEGQINVLKAKIERN